VNQHYGDHKVRENKNAITDDERIDIEIHADYELFIIAFLIVQLVNSVLLYLPLRDEVHQIVRPFWFGISVFLLLDALNRLRRTFKRRRRFFSFFGWMTLVGSMPIPFVTSVRLVGMAIVLRKLRRGEFEQIGRVIVAKHAQATLLVAIFAAVLFFEYGSLLVIIAEQSSPAANIVTAGDALWWSVVTISTVGYGDTYPTTEWGRFIGVALIVTGVVLFTTITSFLARWFIRPRAGTRELMDGSVQSDSPTSQILAIRSVLSQMEDNHQVAVKELEARLERLENSFPTSRD